MSIIWMLFVIIGIAAAFMDLAEYRIPNTGVVALVLLFVGVAVLHKGAIPWFSHLAAGMLCLTVGILFYTFRQMGAGDAKLLSALSLWAGLGGLIPLVFWIAVCGLGLMIALVVMRWLLPVVRADGTGSAAMHLPRVLTRGEGIPFGAGIVAGAIVASWWFPAWVWQP
ncbi:MAG: prepilin peptidase [Alphaproteobacteria bacterium]|nr:prepilin peptidase [Alphaproteobacteria bacterium]